MHLLLRTTSTALPRLGEISPADLTVSILGPALVPRLNMSLSLCRGAGFLTSLLSKGALGVLAGSWQADARPCSVLTLTVSYRSSSI